MRMRNYHHQREKMVKTQLRKRGITDKRVLDVFTSVERHRFVEESLIGRAYDDSPLPIGKNQTISQPYIVALMSQALALKGDERVLEIGTGSGYQTLILANLVRQVFSIERHHDLARRARAIFESANVHNIAIRIGDGTIGWKDYAPYNGIIVTAASPQLPKSLFNQLCEGGRMVIPIGSEKKQTLYVFTRTGESHTKEALCPCSFVPLIGKEGWNNNLN